MPTGIAIIEFDEFEGGEIWFKYPKDFIVEDKYIQQITISHNFISSIMLNKDDTVNTISFYNEEHGKTIALFLNQREEGQDFSETIKQIDQLLLKRISESDLFEQLINIYKLSCSIINVRDQVMLKFANEISDLKGIEHDFNKRINRILDVCKNTEIKILLALSLREKQSIDELYVNHFNGNKATFDNALKRLLVKGLIKKYKNDTVRINF